MVVPKNFHITVIMFDMLKWHNIKKATFNTLYYYKKNKKEEGLGKKTIVKALVTS